MTDTSTAAPFLTAWFQILDGDEPSRILDLIGEGHHDERLARSLAALGEDTLDAHAAAHKLAWTRRAVPFGELSAFNQMLAVNETAAHLDVLVPRGRATVALADGVNQYTRVR